MHNVIPKFCKIIIHREINIIERQLQNTIKKKTTGTLQEVRLLRNPTKVVPSTLVERTPHNYIRNTNYKT